MFYVGMTRAEKKLYLTAANYYGEAKRAKKSAHYWHNGRLARMKEALIIDAIRTPIGRYAGSLAGVRHATVAEIAALPGFSERLAERILEHLKGS